MQWKTILLVIALLALSFIAVILSSFLLAPRSQSNITLATTTSTENSGLLSYLHPQMTNDTGITVDVVAVGTGAALEHARKGLADVVMVHARSLEDQFIAGGYGIHRVSLMHNDFIIVGPSEDPANIRGMTNSTEIFLQLYNARDSIEFVSRGDNSGTYVKEISLWELGNITIQSDNYEWIKKNTWYIETGAGMGQTLTTASELQAYTLTDRSTWLFTKTNFNLELLAQGPPIWHNPYSAILTNPAMFQTGQINFNAAKSYVKWLISDTGQLLIDNYTILGEKAFFADFNDFIDEMTEEELEFWGIESPSNVSSLFVPLSVQNSISIKITWKFSNQFTSYLELRIMKSVIRSNLFFKEDFLV